MDAVTIHRVVVIIMLCTSNTISPTEDRTSSSCLAYDPSCSVHTRLRACASVSYVSDEQIGKCIDAATAPAPASRMGNSVGGAFYVGVEAYLGALIKDQIRRTIHDGSTTVSQYRVWRLNEKAKCEANAQAGPDGSGYGYEVGYCLATDELGLLEQHH